MKLLLISAYPYHNQRVGGVSTAAQYLVNNLVQFQDIEEIYIFSFISGLKSQEVVKHENARITIFFIPIQKRLALLAHRWPDYLKLRNLLKSLNWTPDIIHGQGVAGDGLLAVRLGKKMHVPVVVTVHGMVDIEARMNGGILRGGLVGSMMRSTLGGANGVIFVSTYRMEELKPVCHGKIFIIENAINDDFFNNKLTASRLTSRIIIFSGRLVRLKRVTDLIKAFRIVCNTIKEARLHIIGPALDTKYYGEIKALILQMGFTDEVKLLGAMRHEELLLLYKEARIMVMASEQENAPQAIAEALALGLPVISTKVGGVPFMVRDGESGYLVSVGDIQGLAENILLLLRNDKQWAKLSRWARKAGKRFSGRVVAKRTLDAYKEILRQQDPDN